MFYALVVAIHVIVSLFLIMVVLLQTGKSGDLASAFGGGGSQTVFGPRGTSNVLTKVTTGAAVVFMITSLLLVFLTQTSETSVVDAVEGTRTETSAPADTSPGLETAPAEQPVPAAEGSPEAAPSEPAETPDGQ